MTLVAVATHIVRPTATNSISLPLSTQQDPMKLHQEAGWRKARCTSLLCRKLEQTAVQHVFMVVLLGATFCHSCRATTLITWKAFAAKHYKGRSKRPAPRVSACVSGQQPSHSADNNILAAALELLALWAPVVVGVRTMRAMSKGGTRRIDTSTPAALTAQVGTVQATHDYIWMQWCSCSSPMPAPPPRPIVESVIPKMARGQAISNCEVTHPPHAAETLLHASCKQNDQH